MPVTSFYQGARRDVGSPAIVAFMGEFFDERKRMNDEARAASEGEDPTELSKLELAARKELGELERTLAEATRQAKNDESELARTIIEQMAANERTGAVVGKDLAIARIESELNAWKLADKSQKDLAAETAYGPDVAELLDTMVTTSSTPLTAAAGIRAAANAARGKGPGDAVYDAVVRDGYNRLVREKGKEFADATIADPEVDLLPAATNAGIGPNEWFLSQHDPATFDEMTQRTRETWRKAGGGGASGASVLESARALGVDVEKLGLSGGGSESVKTTTRGPRGGGSAGDGGGSVAMEGLNGEGMRAFTESQAAGEDPYTSMRKAIDAARTYADDLAARSAEARAKRANRSAFPRANVYLANPNTYVAPDAARAARIFASGDPGRNRERTDALIRNNGNERAAYRETGPIEASFAPSDFRPDNVENGGDLGAWLARSFEMGNVKNTIAGEGGWTYEVEPDLSITIVGAPAGRKTGTKLERGTEAYNAVVAELSDRHPTLNAIRVLAEQPPEVQDMFMAAAKMAADGNLDDAATEAAKVSAGDTRAAYGLAMRGSVTDAKKMERLTRALEVLPSEVGGTWAPAYGATVDRYGETRMRGGNLADNAFTGSVKQLGEALIESARTGERRAIKEKGERTEARADFADRSEFQAGREMGVEAWQSTPPEARAALRAGLEANARTNPTEKNKGALNAFDEASRVGGVGGIYQQRTGKLPRAVSGSIPEIVQTGGADMEGSDRGSNAMPDEVRAKNAKKDAAKEVEKADAEMFGDTRPPPPVPAAAGGPKKVTGPPSAVRASAPTTVVPTVVAPKRKPTTAEIQTAWKTLKSLDVPDADLAAMGPEKLVEMAAGL